MSTILKTRIDVIPIGLSLSLLLACAANFVVLCRWL
jgi:hypothetical protein